MDLSDRLMGIIEFVKEDTSILDLGTDHGYIPIYLIEKGIAKKVIASDISSRCLNKTVELVEEKDLDSEIICRLGDGLDVIKPYEVDGVIIAGMGGILIKEILEKNKLVTNSIDYFIFQPMVASKELRKYLIENNFKIIDEKLLKENDNFYEIIYVKKGKDKPREEIHYEISEKLIEEKHPLLKEFIEDKINSTNFIIDALKDQKGKKSIDRYYELKKLLGEYMEVLKDLKLKTIIAYMEDWAPKSIIDTWDNTGFQIGSEEKNIKNIMISLDLDKNILTKAIENNMDLIITHHPIIFKPLNTIVDTDPKENLIIDLIKNDISVYNAHSNLDLALGGVSHALAEKLKINNTSNLRDISEEEGTIYGYGKIGQVPEIQLEKFIKIIKNNLNIDNLILYGHINKTIKNVAVCGGSGSDFIKDASDAGADLYITGDIKYHEAQFAYERDLTLIDVGHFHSEKLILPVIKNYLEEKFNSLNIEVVIEESVPKKIY